MYNRVFSLSFILDRDGYNSLDLVSFTTLHELDVFIKNHFINRESIMERYNDEIAEFCLGNMNFIQKENKRNKRNWTGSIVIICDYITNDDKVAFFHKIPMIYQEDKNLLSKNDCLKRIEQSLKEDDNLLNRMLNEKGYVLTDNEQHLIRNYFKYGYSKYKDEAIQFFIKRLKKKNIDDIYYYCRTLANLFGLYSNFIKTKFGTFYDINYELLKEDIFLSKDNKFKTLASDEYLERLINEENYEQLFNIYSLDDIDKKSNYLDNLERGKKNV